MSSNFSCAWRSQQSGWHWESWVRPQQDRSCCQTGSVNLSRAARTNPALLISFRILDLNGVADGDQGWDRKLVRRGSNVHQMCSILRVDAVELRRLLHLYWPELPVSNRRAFAPVTRLREFLILSGPILPVKPLRARKSSGACPGVCFTRTSRDQESWL